MKSILSQTQLKELKTAVVGYGNMGRNHARVLSQISSLQAVCDVDESKLVDCPFKSYKSVGEMLSNEKLDAVVIAVPTKYHKETIMKFWNRDIKILLEKPIAHTVLDAQEIVDSFENVYIGHIERFNPIILKFMDIKRAIGEVLTFSSERYGISPPKAKHSDVMLDLGIHDIDLANMIVGVRPILRDLHFRSVIEDNPADISVVHIRYENDVMATILSNWITPIKVRRISVTGTKGYAVIDLLNQYLTIYRNDTPEIVSYKCEGEALKNELVAFLSGIESNKIDALNAIKILYNKL
jgi:UDP-N-acetylglucosamine 3-dehydrogenase